MSPSIDNLDRMTVPGEVYDKLPDGSVRCYACGHKCLIHPGRRGICQVRFNDNGLLKVPSGYVAALQSDPIEKKPFFHILPGENALTFGMLGCDFHCGYCFTGETMVITDRGPLSLAEAFGLAGRIDVQPDGEIGYPAAGLQAVTASGTLHPVRAIFKHPYQGDLISIRPYYLPELRCTPDHRLYATDDPASPPRLIHARELTSRHYLAMPTPQPSLVRQIIHAAEVLCDHQVTYHVRWKLSQTEGELIQAATAQGTTSREIGRAIAKSPSYIRHVRSKLARGGGLDSYTSGPLVEEDTLRFPNEHKPGIPLEIPLDVDMARLLGYYCAEGSVVQSLSRPNSLALNFSFSLREAHLAEEVASLLQKCLGVQARCVPHPTALTVTVKKASAALLLKALAGKGAQGKRVPELLFASSENVIRAFLDATIAGDGHHYPNGKVSATTVSRKLAYGLGWLAHQIGYFPSIYATEIEEDGQIQGRNVKRAPYQYTVVWYEQAIPNRKVIRAGAHDLIPLREISTLPYDGAVYNMEVEEEHSYLANFCAVSNCQNWLTSQALRDPASNPALDLVTPVTPKQMVEYAQRTNARVVASSYNEPLITAEWAVSIFKEAQQAGLKCVFISNGNTTPEVLDYLLPYLSGYKIDLKTMNDKQYRKLGGVLQHVLDSIQRVHDLGLWTEVVTLIVPGFNDSSEELWEAARYIASVSKDIPWHVTAFHPDYKMTGPEATTTRTLLRAVEIGQEAGLHFVYAGNLPGRVGDLENTICPNCGKTLIERYGYVLLSYAITGEGTCPSCGTKIPGIWPEQPETVRLGKSGMPQRVPRF